VAGDLFLGVDTGGTGIKYVISDEQGDLVTDGEVPTDPQSIPLSMERLAGAVDGFRPRLKAMGMACAGIIDPVRGTLGRSPNLPGWQNSDLGAILAEIFDGLTVTLANDVNGALYGEYRQGAGQGCENLVMIALGTGVGGGVIIDGKLVVGSHNGAGEIGHTMLDPDGPVCTCGSRGCLESYAGSVGLLRRAREVAGLPGAGQRYLALLQEKGDSLTTLDLADLAGSGDPTSREVFAWAGSKLGQAVGNLINILDPDRVIIGGGVARAGDLIMGPCREMVPRLVLGKEAALTPVVGARLGSLAAAVGAAGLARESSKTGDSAG
jgi:glucokinase